MPTGKKQKPIPPEIVFRETLAVDLKEAVKMLAKDPSLIDAIVYGTETSLHYWSVENRPDIVAWLLERGADPNRNSEISSPLMDAASLGRAEVCKALVEAGANPAWRDSNSETALHKAASNGSTVVCLLLIDAGAELNATEICGETPWDQALPRKCREIRDLLEKHGAKPTDQPIE